MQVISLPADQSSLDSSQSIIVPSHRCRIELFCSNDSNQVELIFTATRVSPALPFLDCKKTITFSLVYSQSKINLVARTKLSKNNYCKLNDLKYETEI